MKLLSINNTLKGVNLSINDEDPLRLQTDKGVFILSENDSYEIVRLEDDDISLIRGLVEDINSEELNKYFTIKDGVLTKTMEALLGDVRKLRNDLLKESDVESGIMFPDVWEDLDEDLKAEWLSFRIQLRDAPNTISTEEEALEFLNLPPSKPSVVIKL